MTNTTPPSALSKIISYRSNVYFTPCEDDWVYCWFKIPVPLEGKIEDAVFMGAWVRIEKDTGDKPKVMIQFSPPEGVKQEKSPFSGPYFEVNIGFHLPRRITIVQDFVAHLVPLQEGWVRKEFNDVGTDHNGTRMIAVIDEDYRGIMPTTEDTKEVKL